MNTDPGSLYVPEAVGFSFESPGWYLLGGLLFLLIVILFFRGLKHYRKNAYRREALRTIVKLEKASLNDTLSLLKLVAMKSFGRRQVAQLYGMEWLEFLESRGKHTPFTQYGPHMESSLYFKGELDIKETEELIELSKKWIKTHA